MIGLLDIRACVTAASPLCSRLHPVGALVGTLDIRAHYFDCFSSVKIFR
jgi:hypothetical protein